MGDLTQNRVATRLLGFAVSFWGLFAMIFGTVHVGAWLVSEHLDLHHNANLWLFWPTDALYLVVGVTMLFAARLPQWTTGRWFWAYNWAHVAGAITLALLWATGIVVQDVSRVVYYLVVPGIFIFVVLTGRMVKKGSIAVG
jgi:hypothetical protein